MSQRTRASVISHLLSSKKTTSFRYFLLSIQPRRLEAFGKIEKEWWTKKREREDEKKELLTSRSIVRGAHEKKGEWRRKTQQHFFFSFLQIFSTKERKKRERYTSLPGFGCVCVCMLSVCVKRKERGNDSVSLRRRIRRKNETLGMSLKKKRRRRRWFGGCWPSRKNGTAESFFTKKCYATFFFVRVCDVTLHHLRITASSYSWLITFFFFIN